MVIKAYILAAEPAWIEASVLSYYNFVEEIIVSYDKNKKGWTGVSIPVDECLERLVAIDYKKKMRFVSGDYARLEYTPMENDTYQRQCALNEAGKDADWVLQFDTDEILPYPEYFFNKLNNLIPENYLAIDWPMRTFFQQFSKDKYLEICSLTRKQISSFPGPIAVKPNVILNNARHINEKKWRFDIRKNDSDPAAGHRVVNSIIRKECAVLHMSWVRKEDEIQSKISSWGHNKDFNTESYVKKVWKSAPQFWWKFYNFHPIVPKWWPALRPITIDSKLLDIHVKQ